MIGKTEIGHVKQANNPAVTKLLIMALGGGALGSAVAGKGRRLKGALAGAAGGALGGTSGLGIRQLMARARPLADDAARVVDDAARHADDGSQYADDLLTTATAGTGIGGLAGGLYMQPQVSGLNHLESLGYSPEMGPSGDYDVIADEILAQYM